MMTPLTPDQLVAVQAIVTHIGLQFLVFGIGLGVFFGWWFLPTRDRVADWLFPDPSERHFFTWTGKRMLVFHRRIWRLRLRPNKRDLSR